MDAYLVCCVYMCRFDLRVVSDSSCGSKKGGRQGQADLLQMPKKGLSQDSKLRYRDGRVVSTKGEKVIIEKVGEDWDGGSRYACTVLMVSHGSSLAGTYVCAERGIAFGLKLKAGLCPISWS